MSSQADTILEQVRQLPQAEREEVYWQIGDSLFAQEAREFMTDELQATLDRRWDEITSGKVQCLDAFAVLNQVEARLNARIASAS